MRKYRQCGECGRIRVRNVVVAIKSYFSKKVKLERIIKVSECPKCKDMITFNIITNEVPANFSILIYFSFLNLNTTPSFATIKVAGLTFLWFQ